MRILACEYVTGGGLLDSPLPPTLARAGDMMLASLVKDLAALSDIEVIVTRDRRLSAPDLPATIHDLGPDDDAWARWRDLIGSVDAVWPVAPESGGTLEALSRLAVESGCRLLGSTPEAVRLTASKRATAEHLAARNVAALPCWPVAAIGDAEHGWIVKPDRGAGCEDTRRIRRRSELDAWLGTVPNTGALVVQPYVPGEAASLSMLCQDGETWLMSCNRQSVGERAGVLHYLGGTVAGLESLRGTYQPLARQIARAIPGLWGYVGVDLVNGPEGPVVLDVNPRLTTSYVGLGEALGVNPAGLVLGLLEQGLDELKRPLDSRAIELTVEPCYA